MEQNPDSQYAERPEPPEPTPNTPNSKRRTAGVLAIGVAIGLALGLLLASFLGRQNAGPALYDEERVSGVFDQAGPAVVEIDVRREFGGVSLPGEMSGSGFLVDDLGHILTNEHIVSQGNEYMVKLSNGREVEAQKLGTSSADDLAMLLIDPAEMEGITPLSLADSSSVRPGQMAIAIGSPFRKFNSVAVGVVSGIGRGESSVINRPIPNMIQTDAPLNPGNSGGPLLNSDGEVIGINSSIRVNSPDNRVEDFRIGFAVPINTAISIFPQLMAAVDLKRPWIGIQGMAVTGDLIREFGFPKGIAITGVFIDSPAMRSKLGVFRGLRDEDHGDIITAVDGALVESVDDMVEYLNSMFPGDQVTLTVFKLGEYREVKVTLDPWPGDA